MGIVVVGAIISYLSYRPAWLKVLDTDDIVPAATEAYTSKSFVIDGNISYVKAVDWLGAQNVTVLSVSIYYNASKELASNLNICTINSSESFPLFKGTFYLTITAYAPYLPKLVPFITRLQVWESQL
jgi:hypothetical protein